METGAADIEAAGTGAADAGIGEGVGVERGDRERVKAELAGAALADVGAAGTGDGVMDPELRNRRSRRSADNPAPSNRSAPMRGSDPMAVISEGTSISRSPQRARTSSALSSNCSRSSPMNRSSTRAVG